MNQINSVVLEGVISSDPKLVTVSQSGCKLVRFDVANHRHYKNRNGEMQDDVLFLPVLTWGELSEKCLSYIEKGMQCRVLGRLRLARWKNKDGLDRRSVELVCDHIEFSKKRGDSLGKAKKDELVVFKQDDDGKEDDLLHEGMVIYDY